MKKFIAFLSIVTIFSVTILCGCANNNTGDNEKYTLTLVRRETVELPEYTHQNKVVYSSDFLSGLSGFEASAIGEKVSIENYSGKSTLKVTGRTAWWAHPSVDLTEIMGSGGDFELSACINHNEFPETNIFLGLTYRKKGENKEKSTVLNSRDAKFGSWQTLGGIITLPECDSVRIYAACMGNSDFYLADVRVTEISLDSSYAVNYPKTLKEGANKNGMYFGALAYAFALDDENYRTYLSAQFDIFSCGNYLFLGIDDERKKEWTNERLVPIFEEADRYYEFAQSNNAKIRGHALVHDGTSYEWFFHEDYDLSKPFVSAATMRLRLEHYIEDTIKYYETAFPNVTYSWDGINEGICTDAGCWDEGDIYHIRAKWPDGRTNWYHKILGRDYFKLVYAYARKYTDKYSRNGSILCYNDWASLGADAEHAVVVANWLNDGKPLYDENGQIIKSYDGSDLFTGKSLLDGIGIEGYMGVATENFAEKGGFSIADKNGDIAQAVRLYNEAGLEVHFSECTIVNYDGGERSQQNQARLIYAFIKNLITINDEQRAKGLKGITVLDMWNTVDNPFLVDGEYAYGLAGTASGFLDYKYYAKPSFFSAIAALYGERFPFEY